MLRYIFLHSTPPHRTLLFRQKETTDFVRGFAKVFYKSHNLSSILLCARLDEHQAVALLEFPTRAEKSKIAVTMGSSHDREEFRVGGVAERFCRDDKGLVVRLIVIFQPKHRSHIVWANLEPELLGPTVCDFARNAIFQTKVNNGD